jgi:hypothetical protein
VIEDVPDALMPSLGESMIQSEIFPFSVFTNSIPIVLLVVENCNEQLRIMKWDDVYFIEIHAPDDAVIERFSILYGVVGDPSPENPYEMKSLSLSTRIGACTV